eukprot:GILJ01045698.1.p2 GENE.GILJ01045698.1~~GILJ01045698.1.p2  ORF type:complete len:123 (-),score=21.88 GILJ01045698.1:189-557(-)
MYSTFVFVVLLKITLLVRIRMLGKLMILMMKFELKLMLLVFVKWVGLDSTVLLKVVPKIVLHMVDVLMVFVIVLLDLWERHVNKKCVQMVALVMVVAMVLQEDVNVMLVMVIVKFHYTEFQD